MAQSPWTSGHLSALFELQKGNYCWDNWQYWDYEWSTLEKVFFNLKIFYLLADSSVSILCFRL